MISARDRLPSAMEQTAARGRTEDGAAPEFVRGSDLLARAHEFAGHAHASQRRRDDSPFIGHPVAVASLLDEAGQEEEVIAAALLHDVVENAGVGHGEVEERFGLEISRLVAALSEDPRICEFETRKLALRAQVEDAGERAAAIYAADKLANLRDLRTVYERDPERAEERLPAPVEVRLGLWRGDLEMVERLAPKLPFLRAFRYELEAFEDSRAT
jgi:(p)ppGpp synthase/HD superfamily hydrolase